MEYSNLIPTLICAILIAWIASGYEWKSLWAPRLSRDPTRELTTSTNQASNSSHAKNEKPFTVRVSGIPPGNSDISQVKAWVETVTGSSNDDKDCIRDITLVSSCNEAEGKVAIIDFIVLPKILLPLKNKASRSFPIPGSSSDYLHFDADFLGFTQVYPIIGKPKADIIFIPGIGGHPYGSWTSKSNPWRMWPRHFLSRYFPDTRVMIYGHGAKIRGVSTAELLDYARGFGNALKQVREKDRKRPIIFVAHSFGGNLLKSFLIKDQQAGGPVLKATRGILFFAVPHRGMDVDDMLAAIQYKNTSEKTLGQISKDWRSELDSFVDIMANFRNCGIASFYEMEKTKRLAMKPDGTFARIGEYVMAVDPESATLSMSRDQESKHPVDADHSTIVKFQNESSPAFSQTVHCLKEFIERSDEDSSDYGPSSNTPHGMPTRAITYHINNAVYGSQFNNHGPGSQYNNTGGGKQLNLQARHWSDS